MLSALGDSSLFDSSLASCWKEFGGVGECPVSRVGQEAKLLISGYRVQPCSDKMEKDEITHVPPEMWLMLKIPSGRPRCSSTCDHRWQFDATTRPCVKFPALIIRKCQPRTD